MLLQRVAFGHQLAQISRAGINVSHLLATVAMEMVVVVVLVDFISVHFSWKRHHLDQTISDQGFDVPVNRGQTEAGN